MFQISDMLASFRHDGDTKRLGSKTEDKYRIFHTSKFQERIRRNVCVNFYASVTVRTVLEAFSFRAVLASVRACVLEVLLTRYHTNRLWDIHQI